MVELAFPPQEVHDPCRVRGRAGRPGRVVVRDVERMRSGDLDCFFDEVPVAVDDLRSHARGPGSGEVFDAEIREELLHALRHRPLQDRRGPFLGGERHELRVHEDRELVADRRLEEFLHEVRGVVEEAAVRVRPRDGHGLRSDLAPAVRADDPVRIEERELRMAGHRVQVPAGKVVPRGVHLPVLPSEVEVRVLERDAERMGNVDRVAARGVDQELREERLSPGPDRHADSGPRVDINAILASSGRDVDVEMVPRDVNRLEVGPQEKSCAGALRVVPQGLCEGLIIYARIRLRPDRAMAAHIRFELSHLAFRQEGELVLAHPVREPPLSVRLEVGDPILARRDLERAHGHPRKAARRCVRSPHAVRNLGRPREDLSPDRVEIERPVDHARVPTGRVQGDLRLLLQHRDAALVSRREPIRKGRPKDPPADDRDVPGLHVRSREEPRAYYGCVPPRGRPPSGGRTFVFESPMYSAPRWATMVIDFEVTRTPSYTVASILKVGPYRDDNLRGEFRELVAWAKKRKLRTGKWIMYEHDGPNTRRPYNQRRWEACLEVRGRAN